MILAWELAALPADDDPTGGFLDGTDPGWDEAAPDDPFGDYLDDPDFPGPRLWGPEPASPQGASPRPSTSPAADRPATGPHDATRRAAFDQDGTADSMAPGAILAGLAAQVWQDGLASLDDDQLTGLLQAANRLSAWSAALKLAVVSEFAGRRESMARQTGDWRPLEHVGDEIAIALTLTLWSASRLVGLAVALDRLPLTRAALASGAIDERRADVIADEMTGLGDEHAAAVEARIIGRAATQTTGQLRAAVRRAVLAADPSAAKRRKEKALKDARVESFIESAGTAALSGRDLPPAAVLAADRHLTAIAETMRAAGTDGTMDQLRARAYLHLLSGQPTGSLFRAAVPGGGSAADGGSCWDDTTGGEAGPAGSDTHRGRPGGAVRPQSRRSAAAAVDLLSLRGTVHLTLPLAAWLGWSSAPGEVAGFGPLDADDSRAIAARLSANPANRWCLTVTDAAGRPVAHGCSRAGPPSSSRPRPPGYGGDPGTGPRSGPRAAPR